ncbi:uncharacterized protein LOC134286727 [Aedes albopictus]|uniref:HTH CENPB-type domain-containing protein n=1 Tax=Aedes albopictus TaxID=7160 RepID=A0ABM1Z102_AEDAL
MGVNKAAKHYGVPRSTIRSRLKMKDRAVYRSGPMSVLTEQEEDELESWVFDSQRRGIPVTKDMLRESVKHFLDENPRDNPFINNYSGMKWLKLFLQRRPKIALRTPEFITNASAKVSPDDIKSWFRQIETYLTEKNLMHVLDDPRRILNGDETSFNLNPKTKTVLALRSSRNVYDVERNSSKLNVTVMFTFHASGETVPPTIIYPYKNIPQDIAQSVPPTWGIGKSDNGWMTSFVFRHYIETALNPYLERNQIKKPVIFIIDGHSSHINLETSKMCQDLGIELIALYPNVTRIMQPADVSAFKPLKNGWPKAVERFRRDDRLRKVTLKDYAGVLQDCLRHSLTTRSISNGFRASGLYPWDCNAIDYTKCMGKSAEQEVSEVMSDGVSEVPQTDLQKAKLALEQYASVIGSTRAKKFRSDFIVLDNPEEEALFDIFRILEEAAPEAINSLECCNNEDAELNLNTNTAAFDVPVEREVEANTSADSSTSVTPAIDDEPIDNASASQRSSLKDFLMPPPTLQRENKRQYRSKRYHVLTSDEFVREFSEKEEEKRRLAEEKENRKKLREERKIANELKKKQQEEKKALKKPRRVLSKKK